MTSITMYDGAEGIGGNKVYLEENGRGVFLDFGKNFGKYGIYYEEFLKNRDTRGIHDLVHLGLIPKLNIYRPDLVPSDLDMTSCPRHDICAVLLSHAHVDHSGNIGLLDLSIPIVASPLTLAIVKGMQDTGVPAVDTDAYYASPKVPDDTGILLRSDARVPHTCRNAFCTTSPDEELVSFLSRRPGQDGKGAKKYEPGTCLPIDNADLPFRVTPCEVDHSIYGATAFILEGDRTIAYTGDFRLHGKLGEKTLDFMRQARDASVLITEGTRAGRHAGPEGEGTPTSEKMVYETCRAASDDVKGLIIADFSPRNFERLETFSTIAEETGRTLVATAKDAYLLHAMGCADRACRSGPLGIYGELTDLSRRKWETEVVIPGAREQYVSHRELHDNPDGYILCFSFIDLKHLLDIKPAGGVYIYSSCEAFSEEMEIDFRRLRQWLHRFRLEPRGFYLGADQKPVFDSRYHASGHASREDLTRVIEQVDPDIIIPVHTTGQEWFLENFEGVQIPREGERIDL